MVEIPKDIIKWLDRVEEVNKYEAEYAHKTKVFIDELIKKTCQPDYRLIEAVREIEEACENLYAKNSTGNNNVAIGAESAVSTLKKYIPELKEVNDG